MLEWIYKRQSVEGQSMHAFYINLDRRIDRREQFEAEIAKLGIEVERFPAIERSPGGVGCNASHLEVLKRARSENVPEVLIFEDDFQFLVDKPTFETVLSNLPSDYDVVLIGYYVVKNEPYSEMFGRALEAQTTSGYIVHSKFYDTLINTWEEALKNYEANPHCHWLYIVDQSWKPLQPIHKFYYTIPRVGIQRPSWSDISNDFTDYQV